jgi:hypothetical protein
MHLLWHMASWIEVIYKIEVGTIESVYLAA